MKNRQIPVFINLLATARYPQMPAYPIQFMTMGQLEFRSPEEATLTYVESQEDEETGENITSDIRIDLRKGQVTMVRIGDFSNSMVFVQNRRFEGAYHTPYGELDMAVFTKEASFTLGPSSGSLHLKYQLHIQGNYASSNELHLEYMAELSEKKEQGRSENEGGTTA